MSEVTRVLSAIEAGDPHAAEQLLPLVYDERRQLAAQKLAQEKPGQTLQATALVHATPPPPATTTSSAATRFAKNPNLKLLQETLAMWFSFLFGGRQKFRSQARRRPV